MRLFCTALVASCLCLPAFAQVYKWVDEKGVTQYGQRPPGDNRGQKMDMPKSSPAAPVADATSKDPRSSLKEQDLEFKKRQIARETAAQNDHTQEVARKNWCLNAKDNLERLRHARIYDLDAKGDRVFKSDGDRDASFARYEANYKQNCQ